MTNDRFTELLAKYLSEQISTDEYSEFEYLLGTDESLRDQFDYFKSFWKNNPATYNNSEALFDRIKSKIETDSDSVLIERSKKKRIRYLCSMAAIFVVAILCFSVYKFVLHHNSENSAWQTVKVLPGKKSVIRLVDGTMVTLNAESSFRYPASFSGGTRNVYLSGEAFFDVKHDVAHPFIVHTKRMNVRVLGTAFDVKSYSNDSASEATLIRGIIEVSLPDRPSDRIILKPNEKLIVNHASQQITPKNDPATAKTGNVHNDTKYTITSLTYFQKYDSAIVETSWLNDRFVFKDEDFTTLCHRLERRFGVDIHIENNNYGAYRFTGSFAKENIQEALDVLSYAEPFHYKENNGTINIY